MTKKALIRIATLISVAVLISGCARTQAGEQQYEASFKKIWDTLMSQNKRTSETNKNALEEIDMEAVIKTYRDLSNDHAAAKTKLAKLTPPVRLKRLHQSMLLDLDTGKAYADLVAQILTETEGSYSPEQEHQTKAAEQAWLAAEERVKKELQAQGFELI